MGIVRRIGIGNEKVILYMRDNIHEIRRRFVGEENGVKS